MGTYGWMKRLVIVVAFALIAAACGDDSGEASDGTTTTPESATSVDDTTTTVADGTTTTTSRAPNTASFRGVTPDTIKVGISAFDWDALAALVSFGVSNSGDLMVAALEAINERGGIHGRMLESVLVEFLPVGPDGADEACLELTQDEEVFLVTGATLNEQILCFTELNETAAIVATGMNDERLSRAEAPYATALATQEVRSAEFVRLMEEAGQLDGKIGVMGFVDVSESAYRAVVKALRDAGFDPVEGLIGGNAEDLAATAREQARIYERMKDEGVDITISTTGVPLEIANARDAGYQSDQWLLYTSMTGRGLRDEGVPTEYLDGAYAVNNSPTGTSGQPELANDPAAAACLDDLRDRTDHPLPYDLEAEVNNINSALLTCAMAIIIEKALTNAGPVLTNESLQAGIEAIGDLELPGYLDASLGPGDYGAAKGLRLIRFDGETGIWHEVES